MSKISAIDPSSSLPIYQVARSIRDFLIEIPAIEQEFKGAVYDWYMENVQKLNQSYIKIYPTDSSGGFGCGVDSGTIAIEIHIPLSKYKSGATRDLSILRDLLVVYLCYSSPRLREKLPNWINTYPLSYQTSIDHNDRVIRIDWEFNYFVNKWQEETYSNGTNFFSTESEIHKLEKIFMQTNPIERRKINIK